MGDEVLFFAEEARFEGVVTMLEADELDLYATGITDPELFIRAEENPELRTSTSLVAILELTFNTWGTAEDPTFDDGRINPFCSPVIREATNWLVDRERIAWGIMGEMAAPQYLPIPRGFPD